MNFLTKKHLDRRHFLKGMGATVALPFLESMVPAGTNYGKFASKSGMDKTRFVAVEVVHGAAGCNEWGMTQNLWAPAQIGKNFDLSPSALAPLEKYREYLTIVSNTDCRMAEAFEPKEIGGDHFRSSAVYLTQSHPKQTEGSDVFVGTSMDQLYANRFGQDTPIPSMQLCIENIDQAGGCAYGYTCAYTDTISWQGPNSPLPVIRDPRVAFDMLFGAGGTEEERANRRRQNRSILDWVTQQVAEVRSLMGPVDRLRLDQYLDNVREIERRIQAIESRNTSGEPRELPEAPVGVPDSFEEHVRLMFDLQALAFETDMTRVFSFKFGRDSSSRVYPESGVDKGFHPSSHHGGNEHGILEFAQINKFHVSTLVPFLDRLANTMEGDRSLLDKSMIMYGSPMSDPNIHNHRRCPLIFLGGANGQLQGNLHLKAPDGTPMANALLSAMHMLGMDDMAHFGDSTDAMALTANIHGYAFGQ
jgi:hypothetical protein